VAGELDRLSGVLDRSSEEMERFSRTLNKLSTLIGDKGAVSDKCDAFPGEVGLDRWLTSAVEF
jgi:hypothetical protein